LTAPTELIHIYYAKRILDEKKAFIKNKKKSNTHHKKDDEIVQFLKNVKNKISNKKKGINYFLSFLYIKLASPNFSDDEGGKWGDKTVDKKEHLKEFYQRILKSKIENLKFQ
jgi:hypothetical protein